jgi:hypothetical protein
VHETECALLVYKQGARQGGRGGEGGREGGREGEEPREGGRERKRLREREICELKQVCAVSSVVHDDTRVYSRHICTHTRVCNAYIQESPAS